MKPDRLIVILSVLLNREQVTAPELAKRFEVSRRTINRDIDALSRAGIPVVTQQGAGGAELLEPAELREELSGIGKQISQQHKNMT